MQFVRQDVFTSGDVAATGKSDIAFHGRDDLDDRSKHSVALSKSLARRTVLVSYNPTTFELTLDGSVYRADGLEDLPRMFRAGSIVVDATTMEFPEILLLLHAYHMLATRPRCAFVYVEPQTYARRVAVEAVAPGAAFSLSSGFRAKNAVPPFTRMLSGANKAHLVAFLGFEGGRLSRVLNDDDGHFYKQVTIVFGVPPFQATWDLHALLANSRLLDLSNAQVRYCGANNPRAAYVLLGAAHRALPGGSSNRLAVAPFGTKPMAIGAALHCLEYNQMRVVYDHPVRLVGRTEGVHRTHWYEVDMNA